MGAEEKGVGDARGNGEFQGGNKVMCRNCHGMDIMVKEPANHTANSLPANNQNRLYCNTSYLSVKFSKNENKRLMSQNAKATIKIC